MDDATVLHHLEELTTRLGIELRYEAAAGRAGLCVLREMPLLSQRRDPHPVRSLNT